MTPLTSTVAGLDEIADHDMTVVRGADGALTRHHSPVARAEPAVDKLPGRRSVLDA
jgi:hypothetical protein